MRTRRTMVVVLLGASGALVATGGVDADISSSVDDTLNTVAGVEAPLGHRLATGDLNGDGYDDLVMGNWSDDVSGQDAAGSIAVAYGSADGLDWSAVDVIHQDTAGVDGLAEAGDRFGEAIAIGNFDGDCCDDLVVGAKREALETNTVANTGWVHIFSGTPTGLDTDDITIDQESPGGWGGTNEDVDWFGDTLQTGDFDGDGYDDLAVNVRYEDFGSGASAVDDAGAVAVVFGTAAGLDVSQHQLILPDPLLEDAQYGFEMAAIPRSGGDQLVIASFEPSPTGAVFVYEGLDAGEPVPAPYEIGSLVAAEAEFSVRSVGRGLVSGDFDGDGAYDLLVTVSEEAPIEDRQDAVAVLSGPISSTGAESIAMLRPTDVIDELSLGSSGPFRSFGAITAVGDYDADGIDDAVLFMLDAGNATGVPLALYGSPGGLGSSGTHTVPYRLYDIGAGDFDGDGYDAYVAGSYGPNLSQVLVRDGKFVPSRFGVRQFGNSWEHLGSVRMAVQREVVGDGPASITLETRSDEAVAGEDFEPVTVTLEWGADEAGTKYFDIPLVADGVVDRGERFEVVVTALEGATVWSSTVAVAIFDGDIESVEPARILETRAGQSTVDGASAGVGRIAAGEVIEVPVAGRGGVPEGASAVAVNTTVIGPSGPGFITLFACTAGVPNASALNYSAGSVVGNGGVVKLSDEGSLCVFTRSATDLAIDVTGFVPSGSPVEAIDPARVLETRRGQSTIDGEAQGEGAIDAGTSRRVQIAGRGGVPADATSVLLNLSAVFPASSGFITVHDCAVDRPVASNLNFAAGVVSGNGTLATLGSDGSLCFFARSTTDLVVDVTGFSTDDLLFRANDAARLFDTRPGQETFDGEFAGSGRLEAGVPQRITVRSRSTLGQDAVAVFVNVTAVDPSANGHIRLYPCSDDVPLTSALNFRAGETKGNNAFVQLSDDGDLCVYSIVDTDLVIDLLGKTVLT